MSFIKDLLEQMKKIQEQQVEKVKAKWPDEKLRADCGHPVYYHECCLLLGALAVVVSAPTVEVGYLVAKDLMDSLSKAMPELKVEAEREGKELIRLLLPDVQKILSEAGVTEDELDAKLRKARIIERERLLARLKNMSKV